MRLGVFVTAALLALCTAPLAAQDAGTTEVALFTQVGTPDEASGIENSAWGFGGSIGHFFFDNFALEAATGLSFTEDAAPRTGSGKWIPIRGRALYSFPVRERARPFLGIGAVRNV